MKPPAAAAYAAAPSLWNSLPAELRDIQSLTILNAKLRPTFFGQVRLEVHLGPFLSLSDLIIFFIQLYFTFCILYSYHFRIDF